jgi:acetyltransferase
VALGKPIIVIKAGRSQAAARAAASHTGALAGSDDVLDAAFRRAGVLRVGHISDLFSMTEVLARQPRPGGPRLTIITNAGGPGVLATDALAMHRGDLAELSPDTVAKLNAVLPAPWSHANPIDVLGDAGPERYAKTLEIAAADPNSDGLLVVLTPQAMTDATLTAEALRRYARIDTKPVLASWMGGASVQAGEEILNRAGIPTFAYADTAARAFCSMWQYTYNLRSLYETPMATEGGPVAPGTVDELLTKARVSGRTLLDEHAAKQVLGSYGIPVVDTRVAVSEEDAAIAATAIGFPVVVKLYSHTITHKTDVGGVKLGLKDEAAVREAFRSIRESSTRAAGPDAFEGVTVQPLVRMPDAYELIVGSSVDPQFGPVLLFGMGGQLVEVFRDRAIGLPPLNATLARRMMEQTRIWTALAGVRGRRPVDAAALEHVLIRLGQLVLDHPRISEVDVNPLLASPEAVLALDARIVLHDPAIADADLPHPVIRPYPTQYVGPWRLADGTELLFRPIRPEDEPLMVRFHQALSDDTVRMRYFHAMQLGARTEHDRLVRVCFNDYDRELALVVEHEAHTNGRAREIVAVGRLHKELWRSAGDFAVLVTDAWQRRGIGRELVRRLVDIARRERLAEITADMLPDNRAMQRICQELGFELTFDGGGGVVHATKAL